MICESSRVINIHKKSIITSFYQTAKKKQTKEEKDSRKKNFIFMEKTEE